MRFLLEPRSALGLLQEILPEGIGDVSSASIESVRLGRCWTIHYRLTVPGADGGSSCQRVSAQHFPREGFERAARRVNKLRDQREGPNPGTDIVALKPDLRLLVFSFPWDPKLRFLSQAADPQEFWKQHQDYCPRGAVTPERDRATVLRYIPSKRCQILYESSRRPDASSAVLGKMFCDDRGAALGEAMNQVAELFEREGESDLRAARCLGYSPEWRIMVQQRVFGTTLYQLLSKGALQSAHLENAARAIAVLHRGNLRLRARHFVCDELSVVERAVERLEGAGLSQQAFNTLLKRLQRRAGRVDSSRPCPIHRDFYDKQLLIGRQRTTLIDLDTLAWGHPEIDLANFLVHLRLRRLQGYSLLVSESQTAFLNTYLRVAANNWSRALLDFVMASAYLRLACHYRPLSGGFPLSTALLKWGHRALEGGGLE